MEVIAGLVVIAAAGAVAAAGLAEPVVGLGQIVQRYLQKLRRGVINDEPFKK